LETGEQTLYTECFNALKGLWVSDTGIFSAPDRYVDGNSVLFPCRRANAVLEFHMDSGTLTAHRLGSEKYTCGTLAFDGSHFWIGPAGRGGAIKRWNRESGEIKEYPNYPELFEPGEDVFFSSLCAGRYVWLFPYKANMILKLDTASGEMEAVRIFGGPADVRGRCYYTCLAEERGKVLVLTVENNELLSIDTRTHEVSAKRLFFPEDWDGPNPADYYIGKIMDECAAGDGATPYEYIYYESEVLSVPAICDAVAEERPMRRMGMKRAFGTLFENANGEAGKKIYDYCMERGSIGVDG
jgi:hypothetical protein